MLTVSVKGNSDLNSYLDVFDTYFCLQLYLNTKNCTYACQNVIEILNDHCSSTGCLLYQNSTFTRVNF